MEDWSPTRHSARRARLEPPEEVDVVVIGAGLGGLSAAAYLARAGFRVACFDAHYVAGGCGTMFTRKGPHGRYNFDIGVHYVGDCNPGGMMPRLLEGAGAAVDFVPMDQDGFDTIVLPDLRFRIPANLDLYRDRLVDLFPSEKKGIDRYVNLVRQVDRIGAMMNASGGKPTLRMGVEVALRGRLLARYQRATIGEFLDSCTRDPKLRAIFLGQSGDYGLPPREVSAMLHIGLANHYFHGAFYPQGGGQAMADRLAEVIEANGGSVHLRRPIQRILIENGRAVGVETEARHNKTQTVRAGAVISNADLTATLLHLIEPGALPGEWAAKAKKFRMAEAIFMTVLGIEGDLRQDGMQTTNYWQYDMYDFDQLYDELRKDPEMRPRAAYITSASIKDPGSQHHAPAGISSLEVMTLLPGELKRWGVEPEAATKWGYKNDEQYRARKAAIEENLIDRLDGLFPGTKQRIVYRESATPVTHARFTRAKDGTGYGLAATPDQFLDRRPGYRGPLRDLYFCGASARAGHGVVGVLLSGYLAARCLARDKGRGDAIPSIWAD
ncbi:MAG: NAD(P)/FAD-dependent oxidoreductase [Myxococcales bacterium]|nr:NAD(P)/FAD-dependent oxidoreductase [Myxococcales bacterium]